ncbi:zinc metallopeptidase [Pendulispora brunnea]|uniref:Zinc metallopeptidase n=1 Tax=Pendulispora brunnea TaxID=2905690 RepID=A0ABZ2KEM1_9BACT
MRWDEDHESRDVIDRRGEDDGGGGGRGPGLLGLLPLLGPLLRSPIGWLILLGIGGYYVVTQLGLLGGGGSRAVHSDRAPAAAQGDPQKELVSFVSFVLDDAQDTWTKEFAERKERYQRAKLVLFTNRTATGCGYGESATGPFYCPADQRVYIDLGFYNELSGRLGARGQFAQAYVIAHEIGHHVQNLLGTEERMGRGASKTGPTSASVRLELQADCYAGMWAHSTAQRKLLEDGDIESAIGAATAIGDDRLQKMSGGTVSPERWTHGSSQQRVRWFRKGYDTGKLESCDTFSAREL